MNEGEEVQPAGPNFMWTEALNSLLIQCMVELTQRHQVHNGSFKNGSFNELERMIEEKAPGCGVKVDPAIRSRHKKLKKDFHAVHLPRNQSSCGWKVATSTPTLDDDVLANFVKVHPNSEELCGLKPVISKALDALGTILGEHEEYTVKEATLMLEIGKIPGLERGQVLDVVMVLVENDRKTRLFFALENEEDRKYFIQNLLR
ncbi:unnamed protein product [Linum tenue]|uniref:Myb/SANT-like domain-containing protein n=1 Tax=Linum tenue TaxID=586396 RepID=A0AAV0J4U3_9ROSI|nr:unnamed protein product [Linum tenue]